MKSKLQIISGLAKKYLYLLLLLAAGGTAILESNRITRKYQPKHWLSGPSGFIMILGCLLLALLVFELLARGVKALRRRRKQAVPEAARPAVKGSGPAQPQAQADTKPMRNMICSFAMLIAYTLLIKPLGFALSSVLYLTGNLLLLRNSLKTTLITAGVILLFLLFGAPALGISFPRGLLGF